MKESMLYKHINDCWDAVKECKTIDEVRTTLDNFPRWSQNWYVEVIKSEDGEAHYEVTNEYFDGQLNDYYSDSIELEIPVDEEDLECLEDC